MKYFYFLVFSLFNLNVFSETDQTLKFEQEINKLFPYSKFITEKDKNKKLYLNHIFKSVESFYPEIIAAEKQIQIAEYEFLEAQGNFDLKFKSYGTFKKGNYDNEYYNMEFNKPVTFMGMSFFAGYRKGIGEFPVYQGKYFTRPRGEVRAGVKVPLWRNRRIDENRTKLKKSGLGRSLGLLYYEGSKLRIFQITATAYWKWVAAGKKYEIIKNLLSIAQKRIQQLEDKVELGYLPGMEKVDNERIVFEREVQLIEAQRALQNASIKLSLFYRNNEGEVVLPMPDQIPLDFPGPKKIDLEQFQKDLILAWQKRPELRVISIERGKKKLDLEQAKNTLNPQIDLIISASKDVSGGTPLKDKNNPYGLELPTGLKSEKFNQTDIEATIVLNIPIQTRKQRGKIGATQGKLSQIFQKEKLIKDKIRAEVQDALSGVEMTGAEVYIAKKAAEVAQKLEDMEREKFELGASSLFKLNQREQKTAETKIKYIKTLANHHISLTIYNTVTGSLLSR